MNKLEYKAVEEETNKTYTFDDTHTVGSLLRHQLLINDDVVFCGYKVPHPLFKKVEVKVVTVDTPTDNCIKKAIDELQKELGQFKAKFNKIE